MNLFTPVETLATNVLALPRARRRAADAGADRRGLVTSDKAIKKRMGMGVSRCDRGGDDVYSASSRANWSSTAIAIPFPRL